MAGKTGGGRSKKAPKTVSGIAENRINRMQRAAIGTKGRAGTAEDYGSYSTGKKLQSKFVKKATSAAKAGTVKRLPKSRTAKKVQY